LLSHVRYYKLKKKKRKRKTIFKTKRKEKEKEILNNDLAVLPSHDKDETPVWTREAEYEQEDQLFMTQILLEPTAEDLCATSTTSQKLAEEAC